MGTWQNVSCAPQTIGGKVVVQSAPVSSAADIDLAPLVDAVNSASEAVKSLPPTTVNVNLDKVAESVDLLSRDVISVASAIERIRLKADIPIDRLHVEMPKQWVWATILMPPLYGLITWLLLRLAA